jgi:hypothetical protein
VITPPAPLKGGKLKKNPSLKGGKLKKNPSLKGGKVKGEYFRGERKMFEITYKKINHE